MALPSTYTVDGLKMFLVGRFDDVVDLMKWDESSTVMNHVVYAALRDLGVGTIDEVADVVRLEHIAVVEFWRAVAANCSTRVDHTTPSGRYDMSKLYDHAVDQEKRALDTLASYDVLHPVESGTATSAAVVQMYEMARPVLVPSGQRYWWNERNY